MLHKLKSFLLLRSLLTDCSGCYGRGSILAWCTWWRVSVLHLYLVYVAEGQHPAFFPASSVILIWNLFITSLKKYSIAPTLSWVYRSFKKLFEIGFSLLHQWLLILSNLFVFAPETFIHFIYRKKNNILELNSPSYTCNFTSTYKSKQIDTNKQIDKHTCTHKNMFVDTSSFDQ